MFGLLVLAVIGALVAAVLTYPYGLVAAFLSAVIAASVVTGAGAVLIFCRSSTKTREPHLLQRLRFRL